MRDWIAKPANFKRSNEEHMELYRIAGSLPNFSAAVLDMLRAIRDGGQAVSYRPPVAAYAPLERPAPTEPRTDPVPVPVPDTAAEEDAQFLL